MSWLILDPGFLSTIQDFGRFGYQDQGIPTSGAMDMEAMILANRLVGNPDDEALIEMNGTGMNVQVKADCSIALSGVITTIEVNQKNYHENEVISLKAQDSFRILPFQEGFRGYLSVSGGFGIPPYLGSCSTTLLAGIGGHQGRALKRQDELSLKNPGHPPAASFQIRSQPIPVNPILHVILGPQTAWFTPEAIEAFFKNSYHVRSDSNRMGIRLQGHHPIAVSPSSMISDAVLFGAIQVPPDGHPIILGADGQTMGGYPKIGYVATMDRSILAQLKPNTSVRFEPIPLKKAQQYWNQEVKR